MSQMKNRATSNRARGFLGVTSLRKKLRRMDPEITDGIKTEISSIAKEMETAMLGMVPVDQGDLAETIAHKLGRDGLTAVVGPGAASAQIKRGMKMSQQKYKKDGTVTASTARNNNVRFQLYKAHWIEFGTKKKAARPFIQPAFDINKDRFKRNVRAAVKKAIDEAAQ